tara:strand:+ start:2785 stop:3963 length:1179 start_codon:yes stop_codon:yes gene_type:complete
MNSVRTNEILSLIFLFIALSLRPVYKYFEYVLDFPRINITSIYIVLFLFFIFSNVYNYKSNDNEKSFSGLSTFWLLLMVSLIQLFSFPFIPNYSNAGTYIYLTIISQTIIQYWLFWIVGMNILKIWKNKIFWKLMVVAWILLSSIILWSALSNTVVFAIFLGGTQIYLMLADSFAVLSIFILCRLDNSKKELLLILISSICLFALFSRASFYCFILTSIVFLYKKNKIAMFSIISLSLVLLFINIDNNSFTDNRMIRMIFGSYDLSQSMREEQMEKGLNTLSEAWILGDFMGDVKESFGDKGNYMHNYLSFWRQFGFVPFFLMVVIALSSFAKIFTYWWSTDNIKGLPLFLFYISVFTLSEIILARSFLYPYIWMSIGGISTYFFNKKKAEK